MKILILNGSPFKKGTVATLLMSISSAVSESHDVEWIDVYDLKMKACTACMRCRSEGECVLPHDDAHTMADKIKSADILVIGTPTHWGNMSAPLKLLFDRNVPVFMGEKPNGLPLPRQKGKQAILVTACSTPWPFNFIANESRGAINALWEILKYGGYKTIGTVVKPGSRTSPQISRRILGRAKKIGARK